MHFIIEWISQKYCFLPCMIQLRRLSTCICVSYVTTFIGCRLDIQVHTCSIHQNVCNALLLQVAIHFMVHMLWDFYDLTESLYIFKVPNLFLIHMYPIWNFREFSPLFIDAYQLYLPASTLKRDRKLLLMTFSLKPFQTLASRDRHTLWQINL